MHRDDETPETTTPGVDPGEGPPRPRSPRPVDVLGARMEGIEAVAEWSRNTAIAAAVLALLCLLAILAAYWRLRGAL